MRGRVSPTLPLSAMGLRHLLPACLHCPIVLHCSSGAVGIPPTCPHVRGCGRYTRRDNTIAWQDSSRVEYVQKPQSVVLLVADSLRWDTVHAGGVHGLPYTTTHGVSFHQARAAGCWTLPATASLFTGLMPHQHGATAQTRSMRHDVPTLAECMHALGYTPHMVSANVVTTHIFGLHRGFENIERVWHLTPGQHKQLHTLLVLLGKPRLRRQLYSLDFVLRKMSEDLEAAKIWLQSTYEVVFARARTILRTAASRGQRVFCFLNLMETHFPYHVADTFQTLAGDFWGWLRELYSLYHFVNQTWMIRDKTYVSPDMLWQLRQRQRQAWERMAPSVDAFIQEVREHYGALVVFGADHGDNFGDQGWQYHFSNVTDAGTRVPLFWLPHDHDDRRVIALPVSTRDVFGALLHAVGERQPSRFSLTETPERSVPIMQSYWYNNRGRTRACFRYNQFAFVAEHQRFVHRQNQWHTAPITQGDEPELPFEPMGMAVCPFKENIDTLARLACVQEAFAQYSAFSSRLMRTPPGRHPAFRGAKQTR